MFKHILVATDGSELSGKAESQGIDLAQKLAAKLTFVTVRVPFHLYAFEVGITPDIYQQYDEKTKESAKTVLAKAKAAAKTAGLDSDGFELESEFPHEVIISLAKQQGCDLIVMASHGRRGLSAMLLGSETTKVLTHSTIPVLVCR